MSTTNCVCVCVCYVNNWKYASYWLLARKYLLCACLGSRHIVSTTNAVDLSLLSGLAHSVLKIGPHPPCPCSHCTYANRTHALRADDEASWAAKSMDLLRSNSPDLSPDPSINDAGGSSSRGDDVAALNKEESVAPDTLRWQQHACYTPSSMPCHAMTCHPLSYCNTMPSPAILQFHAITWFDIP